MNPLSPRIQNMNIVQKKEYEIQKFFETFLHKQRQLQLFNIILQK